MLLLSQLRPRTAVQILDASFQMYRAHFVPLVTISGLVMIPPALIAVVAPAWGPILNLIGNLLLVIGSGATAAFVAAILVDGPTGVGAAFGRIKGRVSTLIGIQFASGVLVLVGLLLFIVPGFIALAVTAIAPAVAVVEKVSMAPALERARKLTKGLRWHVLKTILLSILLLVVLVVGASFVGGALIGLTGAGGTLTNLLVSIVMAIAYPPVAVAGTLVYFDLRVRREGLDVEALASLPSPSAAPVSAAVAT